MPSLEEMLIASEHGGPGEAGLTQLFKNVPAGAGFFGGQDYTARMQDQSRIRGKISQADAEKAAMTDLVKQAGGDPEKAIKALISVGSPEAIDLATKMRGLAPKPGPVQIGSGGLYDPASQTVISPAEKQNPQPIGSGGLRLPTGEVVPPAARPPSNLEQPLVSIVGDNGQPRLVRREEAVGKTPWVGSPDQVALKVTGGRESVYVQRMMMGANQAAKDLSNVVQLPLTASTGIFGGRKQGPGLFDAGREVLANKATGQEAQAYNAMATGFQRSLAQIESAGLMPSGSLTHQMDAVLFKEGDTNLTKLHKLAQTRQIVEAGMEVIEANPRVSPEEKAKVKTVLDSIRKSVPFTHSDLIKLQVLQETNPNATLKDVIQAKPAGWSIRPR